MYRYSVYIDIKPKVCEPMRMNRITVSVLVLSFALILVACNRQEQQRTTEYSTQTNYRADSEDNTGMQNERDIEFLKEQYPEYFELSSFKGVEVFVWETADGDYRCGIMSGTNRMKTGAEIQALEQKSLSITETKMVLEEIGIEDEYIIVIPITQPYPNSDGTNISTPYIVDEEKAEQIYKLFANYRIITNID